MEFLDCALIGVCVVIRSNTVVIWILLHSYTYRYSLELPHQVNSYLTLLSKFHGFPCIIIRKYMDIYNYVEYWHLISKQMSPDREFSGFFSIAVTLKVRSRSPKFYQFFVMSQLYIHANLVRIQPIVHKILYTRKCHAYPNWILTKINMYPHSPLSSS